MCERIRWQLESHHCQFEKEKNKKDISFDDFLLADLEQKLWNCHGKGLFKSFYFIQMDKIYTYCLSVLISHDVSNDIPEV